MTGDNACVMFAMTKRWLVTFTRKKQPMAGSHRFAFLFRNPSAFLKPKDPVMASRSPLQFLSVLSGAFTNLMLTVMPILFAIPDAITLEPAVAKTIKNVPAPRGSAGNFYHTACPKGRKGTHL